MQFYTKNLQQPIWQILGKIESKISTFKDDLKIRSKGTH